MKRNPVVLTIIACLIGLVTLSCTPSEESESFYLRSCQTGRLIGPIQLTTGHPLPRLDEYQYIIANPTESELEMRKVLLKIPTFESHYFDCTLDEVVETVHLMSKKRLGSKVPPFQVDGVDALVTMDISGKESAYDVLCNIAAQAKVHLFLEDGAAVLSYKPLKEITTQRINSNEG